MSKCGIQPCAMANIISKDKIYERTDDISRKKSLIRVLHHLKILVKIKWFRSTFYV